MAQNQSGVALSAEYEYRNLGLDKRKLAASDGRLQPSPTNYCSCPSPSASLEDEGPAPILQL
jgi:hypothetical protein